MVTFLVELAGEDVIAGALSGKPVLGVFLAGLIGLIPNCAASVTISLEGFRYPLKEFELSDASSPSFTISNEITGEAGRVLFRGPAGAGLIVIESKDRTRRQ